MWEDPVFFPHAVFSVFLKQCPHGKGRAESLEKSGAKVASKVPMRYVVCMYAVVMMTA